MKIEIDDGDVGEIFDILCEIPFEHPAIEKIISQLRERLEDDET